MHLYYYRRHRRLTGIASLFDLALRAWSSGPARPERPIAAPQGRDFGLPEVREMPATPETRNDSH